MENVILVVDDERDFLEVVVLRLQNLGYKVLSASDGNEGFDTFLKYRPPIVLTDITMPGMDGVELLKKIKATDPMTEVVVITGFGDMELAVRSLKFQANDFITKPILHDALKMAVERALDRIQLRKQAKAYTLSKAMNQVVLNDLIHEEIMLISSDYKILEVNETLLEKLNLAYDEVIGRYCYEVSHHAQGPCKGNDHSCPLEASVRTRKPSLATHVHQVKGGKDVVCSISCYPVIENGEVTGVIEVSRDITKDMDVQKQMMEQAKLASIGQLAAGVAHEINNPLTTVLTTAMMAQEDMDSGDPHYEEFQTIANETLRCRKIVTSLLDFARQRKTAKKMNDINEIARECVALTTKQAAFKDVELESRMGDDLPMVVVDRDQILQSLINLVLNGIEVTDRGGTVSILTEYVAEKDALQISVKDTGKGISPANLAKIFDPFFTTKEMGVGLGLAITHGYVHQNGGTIEVESRMGTGTTFRIRIPIKARAHPES